MKNSRARRLLRPLIGKIERELVPEASRVAEARQRARRLIDDLGAMRDATMFRVERLLPHGSHCRDTAIAGFKDIDYLVVLDPNELRTREGMPRTARDTVARLAQMIRKRRGGLVAQGTVEVRAQEHSVGVKYPAAHLRVDLVPALSTEEQGCYLIPNRLVDDWIETRPHRLKRWLTRAEKSNQHVRAAIRLAKGWRRARGKAMQVPSYALELILIAMAADGEPDLDGLVYAFFDRIAEAHAGQRLVLLGDADRTPITVRDPGSDVNVAAELDAGHRARLVENARRALDDIDEAAWLAEQGRDRGALGVLRRLFVGNYDSNMEASEA
ncbi:MAG: nucleotidyltransferase [Polyangiaceae bacterium]